MPQPALRPIRLPMPPVVSPTLELIDAHSAAAAGTERHATEAISSSLARMIAWLDRFGETSYDHQSYYAGPIGGRAKALYYRRPHLGMMAVAPMVLSEAFVPSAR